MVDIRGPTYIAKPLKIWPHQASNNAQPQNTISKTITTKTAWRH
jgi:hypothetical protein